MAFHAWSCLADGGSVAGVMSSLCSARTGATLLSLTLAAYLQIGRVYFKVAKERRPALSLGGLSPLLAKRLSPVSRACFFFLHDRWLAEQAMHRCIVLPDILSGFSLHCIVYFV